MPMQKPSRLLPDDSHHLMATDCVLPQVALWGKGMVCALKRTSGLNGWISNQKHISLQSVALREGSRGFEEIEKEIPFMDQSGGGVTFCGGEPLLHPEFLIDILKRCGQQGIHRVVDTTLLARKETVDEVMRNCELLLIDLKSMDSTVHQTFCDVPNELILENIRRVAEADFPYYIRIPLIEGVNADEKNIKLSAEFLASLPRHPEIINLLPYHDIGKGKHAKLGSIYNPKGYKMQTPSEEVQQQCIQILTDYGLKATIGG